MKRIVLISLIAVVSCICTTEHLVAQVLTSTEVWADAGSSITGASTQDGLASPYCLTVSPDSKNVYVSGFSDNALVVFDRDTGTGALTFREVWADAGSPITGATTQDGLSMPQWVTVSPDGTSLYVCGSDDSSLVVFDRNATTGALAFREVWQDPDAVSPITGASTVDGLEWSSCVRVSPDNNHVYVSAEGNSSVVVFDRAGDGSLTVNEVWADEGSAISGANTQDGLGGAVHMVISSDGASLYVTAASDSALVVFNRNTTTGALTVAEVWADAGSPISGASTQDGLGTAFDVAISPLDASLYVASGSDDAIVVFDRDTGTGLLTFREVWADATSPITGANIQDGLDGAMGVDVSPDGSYVFTTGPNNHALLAFDRAANGALTVAEVWQWSGASPTIPDAIMIQGIAGCEGIQVSADGGSLYVAGAADSAVSVFSLPASNAAPVATDDSSSTAEDTAIIIDVLSNDTDADADTLSVSAVGTASNGSVVNNTTNVTYTPNTGYTGTDTFTYTVSDGNGGTDTGIVTVTVLAANNAPVASNDTAQATAGAVVTLDVLSNDWDADSDTLTISAVTQPTNGTVVNNTSDVTYTADTGYSGSDTFTYTVTDGTDTDTATVTVTVNLTNSPPTASYDYASTDVDTPVAVDVLANDTDPDGDTLTIDSVTTPENGTAVISDGAVLYTPLSGYTGSDSFNYTISDPSGETSTSYVSIYVSEPTTDIYVSATDGNDSTADGSFAAPYKTITAALAAVQSGSYTYIMVGPGIYSSGNGETFPLTLPPDVSLGAMGWMFDYEGEGRTVISGGAGGTTTNGTAVVVISESAYMSNFIIEGDSSASSTASVVEIQGSGGLYSCWIRGGGQGITVLPSSQTTNYIDMYSTIISGTGTAVANSQALETSFHLDQITIADCSQALNLTSVASLHMSNSILANCSGGAAVSATGTVAVEYSNFYNCTPSGFVLDSTSIQQDPLFSGYTYDPYSLTYTSPCRDAADPTYTTGSEAGSRADMGAREFYIDMDEMMPHAVLTQGGQEGYVVGEHLVEGTRLFIGGTEVQITANHPESYFWPDDAEPGYRALLFTMPPLSSGWHRVRVTVPATGSANELTLSEDRMVYAVESFSSYSQTFAPGTTVEEYQMVSVPFASAKPIQDVIQSIFGDYDNTVYRIFIWDEEYEEYIELSELFPGGLYENFRPYFMPGMAFWVISRDGATADVQGISASEVTDLSYHEYDIDSRSWEMIGMPFTTGTTLEQIVIATDCCFSTPGFEAVRLSNTASTMFSGPYTYNSGVYEKATTFESGKSYWIKNNTPFDCKVYIINPDQASTGESEVFSELEISSLNKAMGKTARRKYTIDTTPPAAPGAASSVSSASGSGSGCFIRAIR